MFSFSTHTSSSPFRFKALFYLFVWIVDWWKILVFWYLYNIHFILDLWNQYFSSLTKQHSTLHWTPNFIVSFLCKIITLNFSNLIHNLINHLYVIWEGFSTPLDQQHLAPFQFLHHLKNIWPRKMCIPPFSNYLITFLFFNPNNLKFKIVLDYLHTKIRFYKHMAMIRAHYR